MHPLPASLDHHRVSAADQRSVVEGDVRFAPVKSAWFFAMLLGAVGGGIATFTWGAFLLFLATTATVLLLGHSLGSHRKLIHDSYQCPKWLEYVLVYCGVQVGLAGPLGLLRQHELRDYAQRLPDCHDYLRHGRPFWVDAWWQLNCDLHLANPPAIRIEPHIAEDRFYRWLESTWMLQQLPWAVLFYAWGGWAFVFWGVCARVTAGVFGHWLIGYFAHNEGPMHVGVRGAAVQGHNVRFVSLITMGESWHNNHHAFPGSARLGLFAGEWDPGWWMMMVLRRLGWVWGIRLPADLRERPELHALDDQAARMLLAKRVAVPVAARDLSLVALWRRVFERGPVTMIWPGQSGSLSFWRRVLGRRVECLASPDARRIWLNIGTWRVRGLPALLLAISRRHAVTAVAAITLMPLAVALESARSWLDLDYAA